MTRKDYELIARVISQAADDGAKAHPVRLKVLAEIADSFAAVLASTNPRFDRARFLAACDVPEEGWVSHLTGNVPQVQA